MEWVIGEFVTGILIIIFGALALRGFLSKSPVNFWSGDEVKAEEISDIKAFNRANGFIWGFMTIPQIAAAVLLPINDFAANIIQFGGILLGIPAAIIVYIKIEKKYRDKGKVKNK